MRAFKLSLLLMVLALGLGACAGVMEFRLPKEFDGKKKVQDPPVTQAFPETRTV